MERVSRNENCTLELSGGTVDALNLGSYNYLGFADDWNVSCKKDVLAAVDEWPVSMSSSRTETGSIRLHQELEALVARFLNREAAMVYTMVVNPPSLLLSSFFTSFLSSALLGLQYEYLDNTCAGGPWFAAYQRHSQPHFDRQRGARLRSQHSHLQAQRRL